MYKNILTAYLNDSKKGSGKYLTISNVSDEDIVIKAGERLYMNMTPQEVREKHPKVPLFSKSVKTDEVADYKKPEEKDPYSSIPF